MGSRWRRGLPRGDTGGAGARTDHADGKNNIQDTKAADGAAERRMQKHRHERGEMAEEEVLLPEGSPGEIKEQRSHFEAQNNQHCAKNAIHEREKARCIEKGRSSAGRLLKSGDSFGNVTIVDVRRIDLRETF